MARFKGNAHDVYEKNADFIHENSTLTKIVDKPSEHFHKSNIRWSSDETIEIDSPEVEETYNTVIRRKKFSFYAYGFKGLVTNYNQSLFGYSKNKSIMYLNFSGMTTNTGVFFILPGPYLYYAGAVQIKVSAITMDVGTVANDVPASSARKFEVDPQGVASIVRSTPGLTFVVDPKGKTTIAQKKSNENTVTNISKKYVRSKKSKYFGGIYVRQTTTQYLS
jgi:hypothetical protein